MTDNRPPGDPRRPSQAKSCDNQQYQRETNESVRVRRDATRPMNAPAVPYGNPYPLQDSAQVPATSPSSCLATGNQRAPMSPNVCAQAHTLSMTVDRDHTTQQGNAQTVCSTAAHQLDRICESPSPSTDSERGLTNPNAQRRTASRPSQVALTTPSSFDTFLDHESENLAKYAKWSNDAAARKDYGPVLEFCDLLVKGLDLLSDLHPVVKVVATAAGLIVDIGVKYDSNESMAYAIIIQISSLLHELYSLRSVVDSIYEPNNNAASKRLDELLARISDDITTCVKYIEAFKARSPFVRIILVRQYENAFKNHADRFSAHHRELQEVLALFNLQSSVQTQGLVMKLLERLEAPDLTALRSKEQIAAIDYVHRVGGIDAVLAGDFTRHEAALGSVTGMKSINLGEVSTAYTEVQEQLQKIMISVQAVQKAMENVSERKPPGIGDMEVDILIKHHFSNDWFASPDTFGREFATGFHEKLEDHEMLLFASPYFRNQLIDAYDKNGSGNVSYSELVHFATSRPREWSLLRWTACWTVGWPRSISRIRATLYALLGQYKQTALRNGKCAQDYLDPRFVSFVNSLLERTKDVGIGSHTQLGKKFQQLLPQVPDIPSDMLLERLDKVSFDLCSLASVQSICKGRVEFWIFPLLEHVLQHWLVRITQNSPPSLPDNVFRVTQNSIVQAVMARSDEVAYCIPGRHDRDMKSFAYGILCIDNSGLAENFSRAVNGSESRPVATGPDQIRTDGAASDTQGQTSLQASTHNGSEMSGSSQTTTKASPDAPPLEACGCTTTLKPYQRKMKSELWTQPDMRVRSMITGRIMGNHVTGILVLDQDLLFDINSPLGGLPSKQFDPIKTIRLGDIGRVDGHGHFAKVDLNLFDPVGALNGVPASLFHIHKRDIQIDSTFEDQQTIEIRHNNDRERGAPTPSWTWTMKQKLKKTTVMALPEGGTEYTLLLDKVCEDANVKALIDQLSPMWYQEALPRLGSKGFNGSLVIVDGVFVAPISYLASFYSDRKVPKEAAQLALHQYPAIPYLYHWHGSQTLWKFCNRPSRDDLKDFMSRNQKPPTAYCFILSLKAVVLDMKTWNVYFAKQLPNGARIGAQENTPEAPESIWSQDSSIVRGVSRIMSNGLRVPFSKK